MALSSAEIARKRESIVRAHVDAENRHDASGVVSTFHQPKYEVMPLGAVLNGAQPVAEFLGGVFEGFPDFAAHVPSFVHADLGVIAEGRFTGTHKHDWSGIPATGRTWHARSRRVGRAKVRPFCPLVPGMAFQRVST